MRISKNPDERKQEIIDGAIRLFAEKGYDKTSISDIARSLDISQGLCYRYFTSKEEIYDAAIEEYANLIVTQNLKRHNPGKSIKQLVYGLTESVENFTAVERENDDMFRLFHSSNSKRMHNELFLRVIQKLLPHVTDTIVKAQEAGEIEVKDPYSVAVFGLYGQMGMFLLEDISDEERMSRIRSSWFQLLNIVE